jgi:hypothetical protein
MEVDSVRHRHGVSGCNKVQFTCNGKLMTMVALEHDGVNSFTKFCALDRGVSAVDHSHQQPNVVDAELLF